MKNRPVSAALACALAFMALIGPAAIAITIMISTFSAFLPPAVAADPPSQSPPPLPEPPLVHIVTPGQTLTVIAARHHTTTAALIEANRQTLVDPDKIFPGQHLIIPTANHTPTIGPVHATQPTPANRPSPPSPPSPPPIDHIVLPGDTLSTIARLHGVSPTAIAALNALPDPDKIFPGTRLRIPCTRDASASAAPNPSPSPEAPPYPDPALPAPQPPVDPHYPIPPAPPARLSPQASPQPSPTTSPIDPLQDFIG